MGKKTINTYTYKGATYSTGSKKIASLNAQGEYGKAYKLYITNKSRNFANRIGNSNVRGDVKKSIARQLDMSLRSGMSEKEALATANKSISNFLDKFGSNIRNKYIGGQFDYDSLEKLHDGEIDRLLKEFHALEEEIAETYNENSIKVYTERMESIQSQIQNRLVEIATYDAEKSKLAMGLSQGLEDSQKHLLVTTEQFDELQRKFGVTYDIDEVINYARSQGYI